MTKQDAPGGHTSAMFNWGHIMCEHFSGKILGKISTILVLLGPLVSIPFLT